MSQYVDSPPSSQPGGYRQASGWVGWIAFAGILMVMVGVFHFIQGLVALFNDSFYLARPSGMVISVDYTAWGWTHMIGGVVLFVAGLCVFAGQIWARTVGTILAVLSAIVNIGFLAAYPVWSILMIALDVIVIMALTVHGSDIKAEEY